VILCCGARTISRAFVARTNQNHHHHRFSLPAASPRPCPEHNSACPCSLYYFSRPPLHSPLVPLLGRRAQHLLLHKSHVDSPLGADRLVPCGSLLYYDICHLFLPLINGTHLWPHLSEEMATNNTTKVWVRRPNSSPTRIQIPSSISTPVFSPLSATASGDVPRHVDVEATEDFLVDDLREAILRKYPQSLGKHHDTADLSIRIPGTTPMGDGEATRGEGEIGGRLLAPDESVLNVLQTEYPNGQRSHEAWIIITTGGRDNYTRWWLQTGGYLEPGSMRSALSPNPFSAGGWFGGAEPGHQEYFPYIPQTVVTPPGEYPARSRASVGSSVQYPRSQQGRPPLIPGRGTSQNSIYPGRRYDSTNTSSMVVEPLSQTESEIGRAQGRRSPDSNIVLNPRYPPNIRPSSSISARNNTTPPGDYPPNRVRQYPPGAKVPTTVPNQAFQMQLPPTQIVSQKVPSPSSGVPPNPNPQRLSTSSSVRPKIPIPNASPSTATENPNQQSQQQQPSAALKASTGSPKSSVSGPASGNAGGPSGMASTTSPTTRRRGNTASGQKPPALTGPRDPSSVVERIESPRAPRGVPLVKSKADKESSLAPPAPPKGSVLGLIPPINVLIVEDNIINAQILEAFFRKRKLKYATAVNGKQAVEKWRQGGWHLVLVPPTQPSPECT